MSIFFDATGPIADVIEDDTGAVEAAEAADTTDTTAESGGMDSLEDAILGDGREAEETAEEAAEVEAESGQERGDAEPEAEPEAEPQPTPAPASSAATDAVIAHLEAIREARAAVQAAKWKLEAAKEHVKEMKAKWEQKVADLEKVIDDGPEELPLFDGSHVAEAATDEPPSPSLAGSEPAEQAAEESAAETDDAPAETDETWGDNLWKIVTFEQLGIAAGTCTLMREAGIATLGDLAKWSNSGKRLTDIPGVGRVKAEKIEEAMDKYWASRSTQRPLATIDLTNHEMHQEAIQQCLDIIQEIYKGKVTDSLDEYCHTTNDRLGELLANIIERKEVTIGEFREIESIKRKLTASLHEQQAAAEEASKPEPAKSAKKGITLDAGAASDDYEEALEACDEIESLIEQALEQENLSSDGEEFLTGVSDTLSDMRADIEEKQRVTKKQLAALDNMRNGVANWIR